MRSGARFRNESTVLYTGIVMVEKGRKRERHVHAISLFLFLLCKRICRESQILKW